MARSRYCKVCGLWHSLEQPWPIACSHARIQNREKRADFPTPMLTRDIEPYVAVSHHDQPVITSRAHEREFMRSNGLIHHDELKGQKFNDPNETPGNLEQDLSDTFDQLESGNVPQDLL